VNSFRYAWRKKSFGVLLLLLLVLAAGVDDDDDDDDDDDNAWISVLKMGRSWC